MCRIDSMLSMDSNSISPTPQHNSNKISSRNSIRSPSIFKRKIQQIDLVELEESPENFELTSSNNKFTNWVSFKKEKKADKRKYSQEITFFESDMVSKQEVAVKPKLASWIFYMVFTTFAFTLCNVSISHITSYGPTGIFYFPSGTILCGLIHFVFESLK